MSQYSLIRRCGHFQYLASHCLMATKGLPVWLRMETALLNRFCLRHRHLYFIFWYTSTPPHPAPPQKAHLSSFSNTDVHPTRTWNTQPGQEKWKSSSQSGSHERPDDDGDDKRKKKDGYNCKHKESARGPALREDGEMIEQGED